MSEEIEKGVSYIAYFRTDGGSSKLYTQEYVDDLQNQLQQKENIIKEDRKLLEKIYKVLSGTYNQLLIEIKQILDKENK